MDHVWLSLVHKMLVGCVYGDFRGVVISNSIRHSHALQASRIQQILLVQANDRLLHLLLDGLVVLDHPAEKLVDQLVCFDLVNDLHLLLSNCLLLAVGVQSESLLDPLGDLLL